MRPSEEILENEDLPLDIRERTVGYRALLNTFPNMVSRSTAPLSDGYAIFCSVSDRNMMIWSKKPPHCKQEIEHNPRHVIIRAGVTSLYLIGPRFFDELQNAASHSEMLETWLKTRFRTRDSYDGAKHTSPFLREVLNEYLAALWTGRGSPSSLAPLRSSPSTDLTTSDNALWGIIKGRVVPLRYTSNEYLRRAVADAFRTVNPQMLRRMPKTTWRGICLCVQHHGTHTDPLDIQPSGTSVILSTYY